MRTYAKKTEKFRNIQEMQYPVRVVDNLGNEVEENLYNNYSAGKISLITDNVILTFPAKTIDTYIKRVGDYIYYVPYIWDLPNSVCRIHIPTGEQTQIFTYNERLQREDFYVVQTAIGLLFVICCDVYNESGEKIPVFIKDQNVRSEILHHNDEILVAANFVDLKTHINGCVIVFSFKTNRIIYKTGDFGVYYRYEPHAKLHIQCYEVYSSYELEERRKRINMFKKSIKLIGGSTLLFKGDVLELNHDIVAPECYICLQEIYLDPDYRQYKCFHEGYVVHAECLKKTTSCPICRETQRL